MQKIQKFLSDAQKIKKHNRSDDAKNYDSKRACAQIANLFENNNKGIGEFPRSMTYYWINHYILSSSDLKNEPTDENLNKLAAIQSFIDGDAQDLENLNDDDWKNITESINADAEDIPIEMLQKMMNIVLEKGKL